jgi:hypothetical protein
LGYTVAGRLDHLLKLLTYEAIVLLSPQPFIAGGLFGLALAGAVSLMARSWKRALIVLAFPIIYIAYFTLQRVMIVRNVMVVSPFVALLCAAGGAAAVKSIPRRARRLAVAVAVTAAVVFNLGFTLYAAWTIREAGISINYDVVKLRDYMNDHAQTRFDLSPMAKSFLEQLDPSASTRPAPAHPDREVVVICTWDGNDLLQWPASFGPLDVNFNYYPTWPRNRILLLDLDRARQTPVDSLRQLVRARDEEMAAGR